MAGRKSSSRVRLILQLLCILPCARHPCWVGLAHVNEEARNGNKQSAATATGADDTNPGRLKAIQRRCRGTSGSWCGKYDTQEPVPRQLIPRGGKICPGGCNHVGNCNADTGLCDCPAGWKGKTCAERELRPCTMRFRDDGDTALGYIDADGRDLNLRTEGYTESRCGGICDAEIASCYCDGKYRRIPAPNGSTPGTPPLQRGRPLGNHLCQPSDDGQGFKIPWGQVPWEDLYGPQGWCEADVPKFRCPCMYEGFAGPLCDQVTEHMCVNQCSGRGTCYLGFCKCDLGWYGTDCARPARDVAVGPGFDATAQRPWLKGLVVQHFDDELRHLLAASIGHAVLRRSLAGTQGIGAVAAAAAAGVDAGAPPEVTPGAASHPTLHQPHSLGLVDGVARVGGTSGPGPDGAPRSTNQPTLRQPLLNAEAGDQEAIAVAAASGRVAQQLQGRSPMPGPSAAHWLLSGHDLGLGAAERAVSTGATSGMEGDRKATYGRDLVSNGRPGGRGSGSSGDSGDGRGGDSGRGASDESLTGACLSAAEAGTTDLTSTHVFATTCAHSKSSASVRAAKPPLAKQHGAANVGATAGTRRQLEQYTTTLAAASAAHSRIAESAKAGLAPQRRPLIYVYDLPAAYNSRMLQYRVDKGLCTWRAFHEGNNSVMVGWTYAHEVLMHELFAQSEHRTFDPEAADFFYVPVFIACMIFPLHSWADGPWFHAPSGPRTSHAAMAMLEAKQWLQRTFPWWDRRGGRDHIWLMVHDEGACYAPTEIYNTSIMLSSWGRLELNHTSNTAYGPDNYTQDLLVPAIKLPYHYSSSPLLGAQPVLERDILLFFRGDVGLHREPHYSRGIRQRLYKLSRDLNWWQNYKIMIGTGSDFPGEYSKLLARSKFALVAPGDGWSARAEDALLHGAVPLVIMDNVMAVFEPVLAWSTFSIRLPESDLLRVPQVLQAVPDRVYQQLQRNVRNVWHRFAYVQHPLLRNQIDDIMRENLAAWAAPGPTDTSPGNSSTASSSVQVAQRHRQAMAQKRARYPVEDDAFGTVMSWLFARIPETR